MSSLVELLRGISPYLYFSCGMLAGFYVHHLLTERELNKQKNDIQHREENVKDRHKKAAQREVAVGHKEIIVGQREANIRQFLRESIRRILRESIGVHQHDRKDFDGEDCPICHEILNPWEQPVLFCDRDEGRHIACGKNFHLNCLVEWLKTCQRQREPPTCPNCRMPWNVRAGN
ncbi:hypothetical protein BDV96DRAFT_592052 [Lophiotrema nucula]|uniref:RING-type domain-containing protein n=1 Tax=Lophiotrema nucula TaxID=690887 RepID=A0A6A5YEH9_9PLEO|nr:hypothetical protein BDV96DRAFT_592052 [Lophiotrema nucula]